MHLERSLILLVAIFEIGLGQNTQAPEQIHISYGSDPSKMIVTWTTLDFVNESFVEFGLDDLSYRSEGYVKKFKNNWIGFERVTFVHQAMLTGLSPGQKYRYRCGSEIFGWSELYYFTAMKDGQDWSPKFAVYGDMGTENAQSLPRLLKESQAGTYDAVLHIGDFAYDMADDKGRVGDSFMNKIQPLAAILPYMTCVGNHEWHDNFTQYYHRFNMPNADGTTFGGENNHFYSFNVGPVHIISFSTEFYYFYEFGFSQMQRQYDWLKKDLENANKPKNRAKQPWIITMAHRPMYCTNANSNDCTKFDDRVRTGFPFIKKWGLEDMFYENSVDVELWAHEHSYERLWPIYNNTVRNGSLEEPFRNPGAPVHITTGSAGCKEDHDAFKNTTDISAFRSTDYGYTRMQVFNSTHMYIEQVSDDQAGKIIDSVWIVKDNHGPYPRDY